MIRGRRGVALASAFIAFAASACLDDRGTAPSESPTLRLGINATVLGPARTVEIRVSYRRHAADEESIELVPLDATPDQVQVEPGETRVQQITVRVDACLNDPRRVGAASQPGGCPIVVELRLLGDGGVVVDNEVIEQEVEDVTEEVTLPPVTLSPPSIVLQPTALAFEAVTGGAVPAAKTSAITNGGGGTLEGLAAAITFAGGAGWLTASINGGQLVVQPTTTALPPGIHEATVNVTADGASNNPQPVAVTYTVTAPPPKQLTVGGASTGAGRVTSSPPGIDCTIAAGNTTGTCAATFAHGTVVTLNQTTNEGSTFGGWTGDCTSASACSVTMDQARGVTASFTMTRHTLTVASGGGTGSGTVSGTGIACTITASSATGDCTETFDFGTEVTLTAAPTAGHVFEGWGGACSSRENALTCTLPMTTARGVTAGFTAPLTLAVSMAGNGAGSVTSTPPGIDCTVGSSVGCSAQFAAGTNVILSAVLGTNSQFSGWSGGGCSGTGPCTVTMDQARAVTATFVLVVRPLTVTLAGTGTGTVVSNPLGISCTNTGGVSDCSELYDHGTSVRLTATSGPHSTFAGWSGGCSGTGPCDVSMIQAQSVTATFNLVSYPLAIAGAGTGSGRVQSGTAGIDCPITAGVPGSGCSAPFQALTMVTLAATATNGSAFAGWGGGGCSGTGPCTVTMDQALTVVATFTLLDRTLSVNGAGNGVGAVVSDPAAILCAISNGVPGGFCDASLDHGTTITLAATANNSSTFTGWSGAGCSGTGPCTITMDAAKSVTATFVLKTFALTVVGGGNGSGSVASNPVGVACAISGGAASGDCAESYNHGTVVTLAASPSANNTFLGWSGGGCSGTGPCQVTVDQAYTVTASFAAPFTLTVSGAGNGAGSITSSPVGIDCALGAGGSSAGCSAQFAAGTEVTLRAAAGANSEFAGWGGACTGSACVVTMAQPRAVTATFELLDRPLTVTLAGAGKGTVVSNPLGISCTNLNEVSDCAELYDHGTQVRLTATNGLHSTFAGWTGGGCPPFGACDVTMSAAQSVTATFTLNTHPLTITGDGTGSGRVTSQPPGIDCRIVSGAPSEICQFHFPHGTNVILSPVADGNSDASGWNGACVLPAGSSCSVTMTEPQTATAHFTIKEYAVTIRLSGGGSGSLRVEVNEGTSCGITGGVVSGSCSFTVAAGTVVTFAATVSPGSRFAGWGDACTGTEGLVCTVTVNGPLTASATFGALYDVDVFGEGTGVGTVTSTPAGILCVLNPEGSTGECSAPFLEGTVVTLTADPDNTSLFIGWDGDCSGTEPCQLAIRDDAEVTAIFELRPTVTVVGAGTGNGRVVSEPPGIDCMITNGVAGGSGCSREFPMGTEVTLTASTQGLHVLGGWDGSCGEHGGTGPCVITLDQPWTIRAVFHDAVPLTITTTGAGAGTVRSSPFGIDCTRDASGAQTGACQALFVVGRVVTLTATVGTNSEFAEFGGCSVPSSPCTVTMTAARTVTAGFSLVPRTLRVLLAGNGVGTVASTPSGISCTNFGSSNCIQNFDHGTSVTLAATPGPNSNFVSFNGCNVTTSPCIVTMTDARSVEATFALLTHRLTVAAGSGTGHGTVTSEPPGIDCRVVAGVTSGACHFDFPHGTEVTLDPVADANSNPAGWTGACNQSGGLCLLTMTQPFTTAAGFTIKSFNLTVSRPVGNTGNGTVTGGGINCTITGTATTGTCSVNVNHGTVVTLTATPGANSTFGGFTGCDVTTSPCTVTVTAPTTVTASFPLIQFPLTVAPAAGNAGNGTVTGSGINCVLAGTSTPTGTCTVNVNAGSSVTLTATGSTGYLFSQWGGGPCAVIGNQCTVTMSAARTVTASFVPGPYTITVRGGGNGTGRVQSSGVSPAIDCTITGASTMGSCSQTYSSGKPVQLTATTVAGSGNRFVDWSGACTGTSPTCTPPSVPGIERIVTAEFNYNVCLERSFHTYNTSSNGTLTTSDCVSPHFDQSGSGWRRDAWDVTFPATQLLEARLSSPSAELRVSFVPNPPGSTSTNGFEWFSPGATFVLFRVLAPPGTTTLQPANAAEDRLGAYTLTTLPASAEGCNPVIRTSFGATSSAFSLNPPGAPADCSYTASTGTTFAADRLTVFVPAGRRLSVTVTSSQFQPLIDLRDGFSDAVWTGSVFASSSQLSGGTATVSMTPSGMRWVQIWVTARDGKTGPYTLTIDP